MTKTLTITAGVLDALNLMDWFRFAFCTWRYVLSSSYRAQVQAHWQQTTESRKAAEIIGAVFCLAVTVFAVGMLICAGLGVGWFAGPK